MLALLDLCFSCVGISKNGLISASLTVSQVSGIDDNVLLVASHDFLPVLNDIVHVNLL